MHGVWISFLSPCKIVQTIGKNIYLKERLWHSGKISQQFVNASQQESE